MEEKKNLEIVSGDGSNLDISPAYDHLNVESSNVVCKRPKNIVVPKVTTKKTKEKSNSKKEKEEESKKEGEE